jgi:hypothetical protein
MKIIKLDKRHRLYCEGYRYAISKIYLDRGIAKHIRKYYNKDSEIFKQYATINRTFLPYGYIAFKREEHLTLALLSYENY